MALVARPPLVAAVSEAGGLGVLGAAASPPEALAREIAEVRSLTDRPFGVDLAFPPELIDTSPDVLAAVRLAAAEQGHGAPPPEPVGLFEPGRTDAQVEVCCEERVAAVMSALGSPATVVDRLHAAGFWVHSSGAPRVGQVG